MSRNTHEHKVNLTSDDLPRLQKRQAILIIYGFIYALCMFFFHGESSFVFWLTVFLFVINGLAISVNYKLIKKIKKIFTIEI